MFSHYLPEDDNAYRYSFVPKRHSFRNVQRKHSRFNKNDDYDDYDDYDEYDEYVFLNDGPNRFKAQFSTTGSNFSNTDEIHLRRNGDFYMKNRSTTSIDYGPGPSFDDDKVELNFIFLLLVKKF